MLGHVALRAANIWVQAEQAGTVAITYWPVSDAQQKTTIEANVNDDFAYTHTFKLHGLEPETTYQYRLTVNGIPINQQPAYQFTTQKLWQWRTDPPDFSVLAGSCTFVNEKIYDRPGRPYGSGHEAMFSQIASEDADVMLWLGDNWYYREVDYDSAQSLMYRVTRDRSQDFFQPVWHKFAHYATWDDHDFGPNNSGADFIFKKQALDIFKNFWANPSYGMPEQEGVSPKSVTTTSTSS